MEELVGYKESFMGNTLGKKLKFRCLIIEFEVYNIEDASLNKKKLMECNLNNIISDIVNEDEYYISFKLIEQKSGYDISFVYNKKIMEMNGENEEDYINFLKESIEQKINHKVHIYIGKEVNNNRDIILSYKSAEILRLLVNSSDLNYYDNIVNENYSYKLGKIYIDELIEQVQENNEEKIIENIDLLYDSFKTNSVSLEFIKMDFNYLTYRIIMLIKDLDLECNNNKIIEFITYDLHENLMRRGSNRYLKGFLLELSGYLKKIKENISDNVLNYVIKEVAENYMDKLSLKSISEKYYINSAYLGQLFLKKYNKSFKDYLNEFRIEKAVYLLLNTNKKVYEIATMVGYSNTDYFIKRFMEVKGMTPLRYKRNKIKY
ncbi:MAG: helix-turn-helix transcriptional regulator [Clostridium sp.]|uniref:helix-turn-helix domain-containing protein n=1 Tax=Clostridium TaxID=1485 RepID=UPI0025BB2403|nr:helix-turn-helix transcriptional regulator [Clostridium sp.]MBS4957934.1 helix-turn-helix transcriptional regulator [Clostridium sp.]MDU2155486.1 helix-turn-helix transcriptional regulator [Clostridium sp.]